MAFIHTNFLTGNDTTGDGSTGTPYKTIFKALSVAQSNDFIKVAGGQWSSALAGDFTFTQDSNVIQTSVSQVGTVLVDDILSFEDNQFGFDKFHIKVYAVTATTITTSLFWMGETLTTNTVKRLDTYHYSQSGTSPTQFENWNTTDVHPNGRTGITISGGWSSDYTAQNGWTVMRRTGQAITITNTGPDGIRIPAEGNGIFGIGPWGTNLVFDRFMAHTINFIQPNLFAGTFATGGASFAMKELAVVKGSLFSTLTFGFGLYQADPAIPAKLYASSPGVATLSNFANSPYFYNTSKPETFEIDIWATLTWNNFQAANTSTQAGFGMLSPVGKEGSVNQINLKLRQNARTDNGVTVAQNFMATGGGIYLKKLTYYADKPQSFNWNVPAGLTVQIEDIEVLGTQAAKTPLSFYSSTGQIIIDLFDEEKTIDSINFGAGIPSTTTNGALNQVCQSNLSPIQVKDSEGLKTLDFWNNIYFKNNGALKLNSGIHFSAASATYFPWKLIGVIDKPSTPFTVTFTLKVDAGAEANWDTLGVQYGPNANQIATQALTPTSSYATYTMTIDPANYSDWAKFKFPVYFGIRAKSANAYIPETQTYGYIQSVTVS